MTQALTRDSQTLPLQGKQLAVAPSAQSGYANQLLTDLGADTPIATPKTSIDPIAAQAAWAKSGAMALTGRSDGPPLTTSAPIAACLQGAYDALQALATKPSAMDVTTLLGERAAIAGLSRQGTISPGGSCRILSTSDGLVAINLAREDDWSLIPALLHGAEANNWLQLSEALSQHRQADLCDQGKLLGLAITPVSGEPCNRNWYQITVSGAHKKHHQESPLVVDLSSLWAGPLCSQLLHLSGARVIKVESTSRSDGARRGPEDFFNLLNAGKQSVALELTSSLGRQQLQALLEHADIVIEGSRPRALQQLGIVAEDLVQSRAGLTWISITGYGRSADQSQRIAYGDDAGVAAGLSAELQKAWGEPLFCGDAIGDPLAGTHAALAALAGWHSGRSHLFDIALHAVIHNCINAATLPCGEIVKRGTQWQLLIDDETIPVLAPRARPVSAAASQLGADTDLIIRELDLPC